MCYNILASRTFYHCKTEIYFLSRFFLFKIKNAFSKFLFGSSLIVCIKMSEMTNIYNTSNNKNCSRNIDFKKLIQFLLLKRLLKSVVEARNYHIRIDIELEKLSFYRFHISKIFFVSVNFFTRNYYT